MVAADKTEGVKPRGFAGLSALVSEVDTMLPTAPKISNVDKADTSLERPPPTAIAAESPSSSSAPKRPWNVEAEHKGKHPTQGKNSALNWKFFGIALALVSGVLFIVISSDRQATTVTPYIPEPSDQTQPFDTPIGVADAQPSQPPAASVRPYEEQPPVGRDVVLTTAQIRYCMAEEMRLDGARAIIGQGNGVQISRFNGMVVDYNSRCGQFKYRDGSWAIAVQDTTPFRQQYEEEGRDLFSKKSPSQSESGSNMAEQTPDDESSKPYVPSPDSSVLEAQRLLNGLGYEAGPENGLLTGRTQVAIINFQQDRGIDPATGIVDGTLLFQLRHALPRR